MQYDIDIVLKPESSYLKSIQNVTTASVYVKKNPVILEKLRQYIAIISTVPFNFKEDILKVRCNILELCWMKKKYKITSKY